MKEKIKARLKAKFSGVNLSQKRMDAIADKLAKKLTDESEESEIDEALDDLNEIYSFSDMAKSDDRARSDEAKKKANPSQPKEDPAKTEEDENVPAWAKSIIEQNKIYAEKLSNLEAGKTAESRRVQLEKKLENAPEKIKDSYLKQFERMSFKDEEDFTGYISDVETQVTELAQEFSNNGLKSFGTAKTSGGKGSTEKAASKEEADAVVKDIMPK